MQTQFDSLALQQVDIRRADEILRRCVHCGFCTATCPTYQLTGDELDGPRGRIYLIKNLLELPQESPSREVKHHLDRCLGCLSCTTTCPADVNYGQLLDLARKRIVDDRHTLALSRWLHRGLIAVLLRPTLFRQLLRLGKLAHYLRALLPRRLAGLTALARRAELAGAVAIRGSAVANPRGRVILLSGCVQQAAGRHINAATIRMLGRAGYEVIQFKQARCCSALPAHLGEADWARELARTNLAAWRDTLTAGCDGILVAASGCTGSLAAYGELLEADSEFAELAKQAADKATDLSTFLAAQTFEWWLDSEPRQTLGWHAPCSLQHGLREEAAVRNLLQQAGFSLEVPGDAHLCCGAAGTYSILQADMAGKLGLNKTQALESAAPGPLVSANLACMLQLAQYSDRPVLHYVELLDWASGGDKPGALQ